MGKKILKTDVKKFYKVILKTENPSLLKKILAWIWHFELHCVAVYRFGQWSRRVYNKLKPLGVFPLFLYFVLDYLVRLFHHVDINRKTEIGPGLYLGHPVGILIGPTKIGKNCSLTHNVTIGWGIGAQKPGIPVIGDNVWIGPGAVLTGDIQIGNGVAISAGTIVNKSIPDRCLVAGNPGRPVLTDYDNSALLDYTVEADDPDPVPELES